MAGQTPDQIAARWSQNLGSSTQRITDGVNATTVAPGQAAARQKDVWVQRVTASRDKWATNTAAVSLQEWQQAMIGKGVQRVSQGASAAQPKFASFMGQLLPHIERGRSQLPPRGDLEANINRMVTFSRHMATFRRSGQ